MAPFYVISSFFLLLIIHPELIVRMAPATGEWVRISGGILAVEDETFSCSSSARARKAHARTWVATESSAKPFPVSVRLWRHQQPYLPYGLMTTRNKRARDFVSAIPAESSFGVAYLTVATFSWKRERMRDCLGSPRWAFSFVYWAIATHCVESEEGRKTDLVSAIPYARVFSPTDMNLWINKNREAAENKAVY